MQAGLNLRTASAADLEAARTASYEGASPAGKKAQGAFALWAAANGIDVQDVNRIIAHPRMQFALKLKDVGGTDMAEAVDRAAGELGIRAAYDLLRQPYEKLMFIMLFPG